MKDLGQIAMMAGVSLLVMVAGVGGMILSGWLWFSLVMWVLS